MKIPDNKTGYAGQAPANDGYAGPDSEDDGYVVADMSGIERQPLLIPRFGGMGHGGKKGQAAGTPEGSAPPSDITDGERRALIRGSVAAGILIAGVMAAVFAAAILLIGHM